MLVQFIITQTTYCSLWWCACVCSSLFALFLSFVLFCMCVCVCPIACFYIRHDFLTYFSLTHSLLCVCIYSESNEWLAPWPATNIYNTVKRVGWVLLTRLDQQTSFAIGYCSILTWVCSTWNQIHWPLKSSNIWRSKRSLKYVFSLFDE